MPKLRIALTGPGHIGHRHAECYRNMPEVVELVGIAGIDEDDARPLAEAVGCAAFGGLSAMLEGVEADVIDLCTPTPLHKEGALLAANAGKHVICEKPMARTQADAEAMIEACKTAGVQLLVGHVLRFFPQYEQARSLVRSGAIGQPAIVRTFRGNGFPQGWRNWYADPAQSGGLLLDLALHDFDWLRWTFGEVERVYARGLHRDVPQGRDYALVTLRHQSGVLAHVEGTWCHSTPFNMKLEVAGDAGLLDYNDALARPIQFTPRVAPQPGDSPKVAVPESPLAHDPYFLELRHFVDVLQGNAEPRITPEDALASLKVSLAAIESVETGKAVALV